MCFNEDLLYMISREKVLPLRPKMFVQFTLISLLSKKKRDWIIIIPKKMRDWKICKYKPF